PGFEITFNNELVIPFSKLGIRIEDEDFAQNLKITSVSENQLIEDEYRLHSGKKMNCRYFANKKSINFSNNSGNILQVTFQVSNDGVAFKYLLNGINLDPESLDKVRESTSVRLANITGSWLTPRAEPQSGWERTQPSYEEHYFNILDENVSSEFGWTFPTLFQLGNNWICISESGLKKFNYGSHLKDVSKNNNEFLFQPPDDIEFGLKELSISTSIQNWESPWRVIIIGDNPGAIVESNLIADVADPQIKGDFSYVVPGISAWSWALLKDEGTIYDVQEDFIDHAASMGWQYCLVDCYWDTQIGREKIKLLADYAKSRNVGLLLWYSSSGDWNTAPLTPRDLMLTRESRLKEFKWLNELGVRGIKVDFFGGDGTSMTEYYLEILEDAAKFNLMVNFHGATLPRGWYRTYPNLMTMEAVKGFEYVTFEQKNADLQAQHSTILPFTRNVAGAMDFTPLCFSEIPNITRKTSNAFELALSVVFESGIQHFVETPYGMEMVPDYVRNFLREIPASWDEIRFIDGFPGEYVILARRSGQKWYMAGINGSNSAKEVEIELSDLFGVQKVIHLVTDGDTDRDFLLKTYDKDNNKSINIKLNP
ncbi:MAG: glycoside hydrolase family 97 catalytic domain-containing protein, partial [Bacteroidales bacterium]|nr:glycoside hydrolase family 97 catalytic domain-containing protein [Bacteroidales bacterium]